MQQPSDRPQAVNTTPCKQQQGLRYSSAATIETQLHCVWIHTPTSGHACLAAILLDLHTTKHNHPSIPICDKV